jgi:hypothetical protein
VVLNVVDLASDLQDRYEAFTQTRRRSLQPLYVSEMFVPLHSLFCEKEQA